VSVATCCNAKAPARPPRCALQEGSGAGFSGGICVAGVLLQGLAGGGSRCSPARLRHGRRRWLPADTRQREQRLQRADPIHRLGLRRVPLSAQRTRLKLTPLDFILTKFKNDGLSLILRGPNSISLIFTLPRGLSGHWGAYFVGGEPPACATGRHPHPGKSPSQNARHCLYGRERFFPSPA